MHIQSHIMSGWCAANCFRLTARERFFAMLAASLPDLDGVTYLLGRKAYWATHHVYGHNLLFGLALAGVLAGFSTHRGKCFWLFLGLAHLHFAMDLLGSGEGWTIPYWLPFDGAEFVWRGGWDFNGWQNKAAGAALFLWCVGIAVCLKRTPLEWVMPKLDAQLTALARKCGDALRRNAGRIGIGLGIAAGIAAAFLMTVLVCIGPDARMQAQLPALKSIYITLADLRTRQRTLPAEYGEFRRLPFVAREARNAPELAGFFYFGIPGRDGEMVPLAARPAEPHWWEQNILRRPQKRWVLYSDGHCERIELPPDAVGFVPLADAILDRQAFSPGTAREIRARLRDLEAQRGRDCRTVSSDGPPPGERREP